MAPRQLTPTRGPMPSVALPPPAAAPVVMDPARRGERGRAVRVEAEGGAYRLRRWRCAGEPVLACEAEPGSALPAYAARRRLRERIRPAGAARLVLFTDAARLAGVWSWVEREEGGPLTYRERSWNGGELLPPPARAGSAELAEGRSEVRPGSPAARRATRSALLALLRCGAAGVATLHPECADPGQLLQDMIERAGDEAELRRIWRAARRMRILDPRCRCGDWLVGAAEAMAQVHLACLERMDAWVADEARGGGNGRGTRLRDFRAALAAADDPRRWPSRRRYARELALSRNLRGADADPGAVAASAARLEEWARGGCVRGPGTPLAPLVLRAGKVAPRTGVAGNEAAEAAHRAADLLRLAWLEGGAGEEEVAAAALAIRARLDGLARESGSGGGRVDPRVEWWDVLGAGGFHLVRGGGR